MSHTQSMRSASAGLGSRAEIGSAGLVHDLGNLIQIASSSVNIIASYPNINTAGLTPVIAGAKTSLDRAGALVRHAIRTAIDRAAAVEQVSVAACFAEVEMLVQRTWGPSIQLDVQINSDLPAVRCDPMALQNAILNLLFNARDAMPSGGAISIRAEAVSLESGTGVELRVADNGIGMKPDTIVRAFDPFFTTKSDGLGGVGLPIVERFVTEAGGHVLIESEYGVGTTVKLRLPASLQSTGSRHTPG